MQLQATMVDIEGLCACIQDLRYCVPMYRVPLYAGRDGKGRALASWTDSFVVAVLHIPMALLHIVSLQCEIDVKLSALSTHSATMLHTPFRADPSPAGGVRIDEGGAVQEHSARSQYVGPVMRSLTPWLPCSAVLCSFSRRHEPAECRRLLRLCTSWSHCRILQPRQNMPSAKLRSDRGLFTHPCSLHDADKSISCGASPSQNREAVAFKIDARTGGSQHASKPRSFR